MNRLENIYLIGLMGAGKTTIGRYLAKALQKPFHDSDKAIEESTGVDIPTIFEFEGEAGFRQREEKMIEQLTQLSGIVLATGGGAILSEKNRRALREHGWVVYLQCSTECILDRTRRDTQRPLLQTTDRRERIQTLTRERHPIYQAIADFTVDTGRIPSKNAVKVILQHYQNLTSNHE